MILFYSRDTDDLVNQVIDCLDENFTRIGDKDKIFIEHIISDNNETVFNISNSYFKDFNIESVTSIWYNGGGASTDGSSYENECYVLLVESLLNNLSVKKIGRSIEKYDLTKLGMHLEAIKMGLRVPSTLITGEKKKLTSFYNLNAENGIICKRILDQPFYKNENRLYDFTLTFSIDPSLLKKIPENFALSLFQEKILPDFEIRVIYIHGAFYSMSIHSFDNAVDYRTKLKSLKNIRLVPFDLPNKIKKSLIAIFNKFTLNYGSADLIYSKGFYYFLEINPIGQISFVNNVCNFYIEKYISNLLKNEI